MKQLMPKRLIVKPCDMQVLMGVNEKAARNILNKIKEQLGKKKKGLLLIEEFCQATGVPIAVMVEIINIGHLRSLAVGNQEALPAKPGL